METGIEVTAVEAMMMVDEVEEVVVSEVGGVVGLGEDVAEEVVVDTEVDGSGTAGKDTICFASERTKDWLALGWRLLEHLGLNDSAGDFYFVT